MCYAMPQNRGLPSSIEAKGDRHPENMDKVIGWERLDDCAIDLTAVSIGPMAASIRRVGYPDCN